MNPAEDNISPETSPPRSRRALLVGAAVTAAVAGGALSWWQGRDSAPGHASGPVAEPVPGFWGLQWEAPDGTVLAAKTFQGRPLLINFWATWCPPCVEELPLLNQFFQQHKAQGWQVVGLAIDKKSAVQPFLQKMPLDFPVALAGLSGTDLGRTLGNVSGSLPFTVVVGGDGTVLHRKPGRVTPEDLLAWSALK